MSEQRNVEVTEQREDLRGTWKDWPAMFVFIALAIAIFVAASGGSPVRMVLVAALFGLVWMIRAGVFTPRKR